MARRGGWRRVGSRRRFRYEDSRGKPITDPDKLKRIEELVIPPAWRDVWISPRPNAKLQATGVDAAGRRQYLYHPEYRARQEQTKYDKLVRFAEHLADVRKASSEHLDGEEFTPEWTCALAVKLINLGWFRVGADRYAKRYRTFGITTLNKSHVSVRGSRVSFKYRGKHKVWVRTAVVDAELADAMKALLSLEGGRRLFRYRLEDGSLVNLSSRKLNEYIRGHMGEDFTAKDFRTWAGTLLAVASLRELGPAATQREGKSLILRAIDRVAERLNNTRAVCRKYYVHPAVFETYLAGTMLKALENGTAKAAAEAAAGLREDEQAVVRLLTRQVKASAQ